MEIKHYPDITSAVELARQTFLREDNFYGCAETTYFTLKHIFKLKAPEETAAAMVLNGGIAYSGSTCGALTGAAMALGELAEKRIGDHRKAKRTARKLEMELMKDFRKRFGSENCLDLIELDISRQDDHDRFIESGIWRTRCMEQIEYTVKSLFPLGDPEHWKKETERVNK